MDSLPAEPEGKPKNTGVGSLSLLQKIFPTQESNQGLLHCRQILYQLSYQGNPRLRLNPRDFDSDLEQDLKTCILVAFPWRFWCKWPTEHMLANQWHRSHTPWPGFQGPLKFDAHLLSQQYPSLTLTPPPPAHRSLTLVLKTNLVGELSLHCAISGYLLELLILLGKTKLSLLYLLPLASVCHRVVQAVGCHTYLGCEQFFT